MKTNSSKLNILATNPTLGFSFNYLWVGHYSIQNKTLA